MLALTLCLFVSDAFAQSQKADFTATPVQLTVNPCTLVMRGRHVRSTMAPLSAPVSAHLSAPNTSPAFDDSCTRNSLQRQRIPAVAAVGGRAGRTAHWAVRWGSARVPRKGGATPYFGVVPAPAPLGSAAAPGGRSPFARDKKLPDGVPSSDRDGAARSITTATTTAARNAADCEPAAWV